MNILTDNASVIFYPPASIEPEQWNRYWAGQSGSFLMHQDEFENNLMKISEELYNIYFTYFHPSVFPSHFEFCYKGKLLNQKHSASVKIRVNLQFFTISLIEFVVYSTDTSTPVYSFLKTHPVFNTNTWRMCASFQYISMSFQERKGYIYDSQAARYDLVSNILRNPREDQKDYDSAKIKEVIFENYIDLIKKFLVSDFERLFNAVAQDDKDLIFNGDVKLKLQFLEIMQDLLVEFYQIKSHLRSAKSLLDSSFLNDKDQQEILNALIKELE